MEGRIEWEEARSTYRCGTDMVNEVADVLRLLL